MRILIGHDGSESCDAAIDDLARGGLPVEADVLVVSVADLVPVSVDPRERTAAAQIARTEREVALEDARAWAEHGRTNVRRVEPSWDVACETFADSPWWALVQRARTWRADLLVVGSHGRSAPMRAVFGSVAQKVLHEAPCSVRVGRGRPAGERPGAERLVVAVDGSAGGDAALAAVLSRKWAAGSAARVVTIVNPTVLSAFEKYGEGHGSGWAWIRTVNTVAVQKLAAAGIDAAGILAEGDAKRDIVAEADGWGADCIFLGERGLHGAERALLGSVASSVAARAPCSVEVVRVRSGD